MKFKNGIEYSSVIRGGIEYGSVFRGGVEYGGGDAEYIWFSYTIGSSTVIPQAGMAASGYWPDGKLTSLKDATSEDFVMYWPERGNYRTENISPYPEAHKDQVLSGNNVFGQGVSTVPDFYDNGAWFIGVHRLPDNRLAGFFHAESGWGGLEAYKTIGVTYSNDNGLTWSTGEKILSPNYPKPSTSQWGGVGDGCVIYNEELGAFICYYSAYVTGMDFMICMAISNAVDGASGSWLKWDGSDFTVEGYNDTTGIGGADSDISELSDRSGANPSVMWNTFLNKWIMVYAGWDNTLYLSASDDGITWELPIPISETALEDSRYPNLISSGGDSVGGQVVKLYYGRNQSAVDGTREFSYRTLTWTERPPNPNLPDPITTEITYVFTVGQTEPAIVEVTNLPPEASIEWWVLDFPPNGLDIGSTNPATVNPAFLVQPVTVPGFVRFNQDGYYSEWESFTIEVV